MKIINIICNKKMASWRYSDSHVHDSQSACDWIEQASKLPDMETEHFKLENLLNLSDEDNTTILLLGNSKSSDIYQKTRENHFDVISLIGEYKGKPAVINVDLNQIED